MGDKPELILLGAYWTDGAIEFLFNLLKERSIPLSISHERMPSIEEHVDFVRSKPYKYWAIVWHNADARMIGAVYLSKQNEIGVQILKEYQRRGYGEWAVREMMQRLSTERYFANINTRNEASLALFRKLGFTDWQVTLANPGKARRELSGAGAGVHPASDDDEDSQTRPG